VAVGAGVGDVLVERGVDYGLGKLADIYRPGRAGPASSTEYDPATQRCRSTTEAHAVSAGRLSARTIAQAAQTIARTIPAIADAR
jgi:hypothetical protein